MKTYHFMAGLPRSGSTLLKSILDQNPNLHTNPVSPVMELMYHTEEYFKKSEQYLAYEKPKNAHKIIKSYIENYYYEREEDIIIDHCRSWPNNIERIKTYITPNPKIICPVRDILEILTSFIDMIHRNSDQTYVLSPPDMGCGVIRVIYAVYCRYIRKNAGTKVTIRTMTCCCQ